MSKLTDTQLSNMLAAGGLDAIAAKHIIHLQKTIDVTANCMKEMQYRIAYLATELKGCEQALNEQHMFVDPPYELPEAAT